MIIFRCGNIDAEIFSKEFIDIQPSEFINLPKYHVYVRLSVDGIISKPFLALTYPPREEPEISYADEIIRLSRLKYSKNKKIVESKIFAKYREYIKEKSENLVECKYCQEKFYSYGDTDRRICYECEEKSKEGIKLSSLVSKNIKTNIKKSINENLVIPNKPKDEQILDEIFKKISD
jgi:hypothetical protein